ncbi:MULTISPECIES: putative lipid II flippase FtsW [Thiothrix]|jgi:cell division protein FtsW|uniref:Probable peptidoglycan glycosyltransferase FtsW n=2 Tax=Thiothrix TaxID=1030 RepID=A0A975FAD4_9GAMM|nr:MULTISPECIES: putative lipid II flippase FtsW [Thiothrix]MDX9989326.1 putative lipid II flippase FtsW [Thiothrix unzii]OQX07397.1 MAG: putative lipid II flippase FtsW [Thiothrix lacustris]QTR53971.1 putative lipid II flippase FtsW [Thiothrix unzii]
MNTPVTPTEMLTQTTWGRYVDRDLLVALLALLGIGIVMLASASLWVSEKKYADPYVFLERQLMFLGVGVVFAIALYQITMRFWQQLGVRLLPLVLVLLILVLIPGIGNEVNGSRRWLNFGFASIQVSELAKLIMLLYLSGYLVRHGKNLALSPSYQPLLIPLLVLAVTGALLLMEPDFGSTVIIFVTGLALLFLGGVPLKRLGILLGGAILVMIPLAFMGYRGRRLQAFLNPWDYESGIGYQMVNAQMAIGEGGWFGSGLGGGVQKLLYLPEAHNDFIFSILAEEFGFIGILVVLALYGWLVLRAFVIGFQADKSGKHFGAYVAYGIGFWMGFQVILHIGVNLGMLPPKGLTLPLMSYGGSSLMVTLMAMALLMRVHRENCVARFGLPERKATNTRKAATIRRTSA